MPDAAQRDAQHVRLIRRRVRHVRVPHKVHVVRRHQKPVVRSPQRCQQHLPGTHTRTVAALSRVRAVATHHSQLGW